MNILACAKLWNMGLSTKEIAQKFDTHEANVYNNMTCIRFLADVLRDVSKKETG